MIPMAEPKRWVFVGTPEFAVTVLDHLADGCWRGLVGIITRPDAPRGRGRKVVESPVSRWADGRGFLVKKPSNGAQVAHDIAQFSPDFVVVAAFGLMIPADITNQMPVINVHPSLLPEFRGASPIQSVLRLGRDVTGVSLIQLTEHLDAGPIYARQAIDIAADETAGELAVRLAILGAELVSEWILGGGWDWPSAVQNETLATYCGKIQPDDLELLPTDSAIEMHRKIRAYSPSPGAYFMIDGSRIRVLKARLHDDRVILDMVAPAGKPPMRYRDFCNGNSAIPGFEPAW